MCLVPLKYREPGPEGAIPALTFSSSNCAFLPLDRVLSDASTHRERLQEGWDASAGLRERLRAANAGDSEFVYLLPVLFAPQLGPAQLGYYPMHRTFGSSMHPDPTWRKVGPGHLCEVHRARRRRARVEGRGHAIAWVHEEPRQEVGMARAL
ncbi:hypothetical protein K466DRAFT_165304 [Polyporus arcularius HHB13444]|uniref:Uncharacterized protein n=1 Tax=Polyporus arcularius HHB13444 TaxID=1314778 RepID=A0A5C3P8T2_9APHY|nr:hypothetical protein K466DRAFT_165304 [Polyporus arcularius HHB13444]